MAMQLEHHDWLGLGHVPMKGGASHSHWHLY